MTAARLRAFLELTKPRITQLVVLTAAAGFVLAARQGLDVFLLLHTMIGTALVAAGTNALNQLRERDVDARMRRTRSRPLPSGRLGAREAAVFAGAISVAGTGYLAAAVNLLTAGLAAVTLLSYVVLYTPLKRRTPANTLIGAVPGALPIVGGWTAAGGELGTGALVLFWILFLWQLPHFLALAWLYRADYAAAGFAMLSVGDQDGRVTARQATLYAVALVPTSLTLTVLGVTGAVYFWGALALGASLCAASGALAARRNDASARRLFLASVLYLPALLVLMVADKVPR